MNRRELFKFIATFNIFAKEIETKKQSSISSLDRLCFIGIGGGGTNILEDISKLDNKHTFIHINSDYHSLKQKTSPHKILLGWNEKAGLGCGGKEQCGRSLINDNIKKELCKLTKNKKIVYLVSTLGGGVGSGATPEILQYLKTLNKKVIVFVTMPFNFEGKRRFSAAYNALDKIELHTDNLIIFKNDDLIANTQSKSLGIKDTFKIISNTIYKKISDEDYRFET